jgi:hypothetical protein
MRIDPLTYADDLMPARHLLRHLEILRVGQLHQPRIARNHPNHAAIRFHDRRLISWLPIGRPATERRSQPTEPERLRRLGAPEPLARHGLHNLSNATLQGLSDRQDGYRTVAGFQAGQKLLHYPTADKRSGRIMHQDVAIAPGCQGCQARPDGHRPGLAAYGRAPLLQPLHSLPRVAQAIRRHHNHQLCRSRRQKSFDRPTDDGPPAKHPPGLGRTGTRPEARARRHDHRREVHDLVFRPGHCDVQALPRRTICLKRKLWL